MLKQEEDAREGENNLYWTPLVHSVQEKKYVHYIKGIFSSIGKG